MERLWAGAGPPGGAGGRHRPRRAGGHPGGLWAGGELAAEWLYPVCHPGALSHVRRGIISARIPEIYYGAKDAGFGACGSILNLFEEDFRHHPKIVGHILEAECAALLRDFLPRCEKKRCKLKGIVTIAAFFCNMSLVRYPCKSQESFFSFLTFGKTGPASGLRGPFFRPFLGPEQAEQTEPALAQAGQQDGVHPKGPGILHGERLQTIPLKGG